MFNIIALVGTFLSLLVEVKLENIDAGLVHVQTFYGEIGASNFTYYKLTLQGHVVVRLRSLEGDADLYLSTDTLKPTWEDYTMKSATCSEDLVIVHAFHERPVGIGVYGYILHPLSKFQLGVYINEKWEGYYPEMEGEESQETSQKSFLFNSFKKPNPTPSLPNDEEESLLWNIFVGFLKILFDILI